MSACRNVACDNADDSKGICAPGDTPGYCIACDDARGGYDKPCPWPQPTCPCGRFANDAAVDDWDECTIETGECYAGLRCGTCPKAKAIIDAAVKP